MKIRNGFVSNSSSSSFVVTVRDDVEVVMAKARGEKYKAPITKAQAAMLKEYGFKPGKSIEASQIEAGVKPKKGRNVLWYSVICNQDDVIEFLVENRIPFTAACHYGHETVIYNGIGDSYKEIRNLGLVHEMYRSCPSLDYGKHADGCYQIRKVGNNEDS